MAVVPSFQPNFAAVFESRLGRPPHKRNFTAEKRRQARKKTSDKQKQLQETFSVLKPSVLISAGCNAEVC